MTKPQELERPPQWVTDCIEYYQRTKKRGPFVRELMAWREAEASCRESVGGRE